LGAGGDGRRLAVRNGRLPSREILTGAGPLSVEVPRVRHPWPRANSVLQAVRFEDGIEQTQPPTNQEIAD